MNTTNTLLATGGFINGLPPIAQDVMDRIDRECAKAVIPDKRKTMFAANELELLPRDSFCVSRPKGAVEVLYRPSSAKHKLYHESTLPKMIMEGRRGTGKSHTMRWDFHIRAMGYAGFKYLMLRRTMPELRKSHLQFVETDMDKMGGRALGVRSGNVEMHYPNGSRGLFGHCETEADVLKYLSAQFDAICFDEITTFDWDMVTRISTSCRVIEGSGLIAIIRGGTNPIGISADEVHHYFIAKDITREEDAKYDPADWGSLHIERTDSAHIDYDQYDKQFVGLSKAYQDAWLDGKWGVEGAYFDIDPSRHLLNRMPDIQGSEGMPPRMALFWPWLNIYCVFDYGFHDPAVCVWIAVMPNGRYIPFKEMSWVRKTAQQIIPELIAASEGMKVITTIADPTLWDGEKEMGTCMAHLFENAGINMTKGVNDRTAAGFAIQELLNTNLPDGEPTLQIMEKECSTLVKTLGSMRIDKKHPGRIADSKVDHMPIALGYLAQARPPATRIPAIVHERPWMGSTDGQRKVLGAGNVRRRANSVYEN